MVPDGEAEFPSCPPRPPSEALGQGVGAGVWHVVLATAMDAGYFGGLYASVGGPPAVLSSASIGRCAFMTGNGSQRTSVSGLGQHSRLNYMCI